MAVRQILKDLARRVALLGLILAPVGVVADDAKGVVVFDIDGTLTPTVMGISQVRVGAVQAADAFADAGFEVIYVTARIPLFQSRVQGWLDKNGFPAGAVYLTQTDEDREDHQAFKERVLKLYVDDGRTFVAAFGDSTSDFEAYANSGVAPDRVFALRRRNARQCQSGRWSECYDGWPALMPQINALIAGGAD